jgi:hypothetical protein
MLQASPRAEVLRQVWIASAAGVVSTGFDARRTKSEQARIRHYGLSAISLSAPVIGRRRGKMTGKIRRYGPTIALAAASFAALAGASPAQTVRPWHENRSYYDYAPGYHRYMPNPSLGVPGAFYDMVPTFGPPDPASCGGFRC